MFTALNILPVNFKRIEPKIEKKNVKRNNKRRVKQCQRRWWKIYQNGVNKNEKKKIILVARKVKPKRKEEIMSHHNKLVHWNVWLADWWVQLLSSQKLWHTQKWNHGMILRQFDQRICNQQETKEWRQIILTIYIKFGEYD
jgi:hypothetical protein